MKKAAVIVLLVIYSSATMGATVYTHYCMNEFVGWNFFKGKDEKCVKCGMEEEDQNGCCRDEHSQFKLKTDHQKTAIATFINLPSIQVLSAPGIDFNTNSERNITEIDPSTHAPPVLCHKNLHALHCVFLI